MELGATGVVDAFADEISRVWTWTGAAFGMEFGATGVVIAFADEISRTWMGKCRSGKGRCGHKGEE